MKICFLAASNSIHSYKWIHYFHEQGYQILWISASPNLFEIPEEIDFVSLPYHESIAGRIKSIVEVRRTIATFKPDVVHIHYVGLYGLLGLFAGVPQIVATPWGSDVIEGKLHWFKRSIIRKILHRARLITCDAYHMRDELEGLGINTDKVHLINFGIDSERFRERTVNGQIREQLGVGEKPTVISLRSFEPVYDIDTLIRAVPLVQKEIADIQFVLVGKGTLEEELKQLASSLGVVDVVHFVGYLPNEQLPDTLSSLDVYVSTSLSDAGIAASTAEAMACGLPVVITDSGENSCWVDDGENGFLVPISEPEMLAQRMVELLQNQALRREMGKKGRATIRARNDYRNEMAKMDQLYQQLIKR